MSRSGLLDNQVQVNEPSYDISYYSGSTNTSIGATAVNRKTKKRIAVCVLVASVVAVLAVFSISIILRINDAVEDSHGGMTNFNTSPVGNCSDDFIGASCADGFIKENDTCVPSCAKFNYNTPPKAILTETITQWTGWYGFITGVIVLILSAIKYKFIFKFPSIFLVYMTVSYCIVEVFVLINNVVPSNTLYCKYSNLLESINEPTSFCKASGIAFHYLLVNATIWWFFHVSLLFYKLMLPLKANKYEKYERYIHGVLVVIGLSLPLPAVLFTMLHSKYVIVVFPPLLCLPYDTKVFYYSTVLVLNLLTAIGVSMVIPMFWVVHKQQGKINPRTGRAVISVPEIKLLFFMCYYAVFGIVAVFYYQFTIQDQSSLLTSLMEYFVCNYCGISADQTCDQNYHKYNRTILRTFSFIMLSLIPTALLVFIINWKTLRVAFLKHVKERRRQKLMELDVQSKDLSVHSALSPYPESSTVYYTEEAEN